jgi:insulysin
VDKKIPRRNFSLEGPLFDKESALGHLVKIVPNKDIKQLNLNFSQLPDDSSYWESKPMHYISHNIGHEGKNSLLSELIKQDLVSSLTTGRSTRLDGQLTTFTIGISLTDKGLENYQDIIRLIFAYINQMKN